MIALERNSMIRNKLISLIVILSSGFIVYIYKDLFCWELEAALSASKISPVDVGFPRILTYGLQAEMQQNDSTGIYVTWMPGISFFLVCWVFLSWFIRFTLKVLSCFFNDGHFLSSKEYEILGIVPGSRIWKDLYMHFAEHFDSTLCKQGWCFPGMFFGITCFGE